MTQADNAAYIPTKKLFYVVDKEAVIRNKVVGPEDYDNIVDTIFINFGSKNYVTKDELMALDMINSTNWKRPIYWAITVGRDKYLTLQDYFQLEGFAYRFVPIKSKRDRITVGRVKTDVMYENMMNKFTWGNMNNPEVYIDENNSRMMMNIRNNFNRLAGALIKEGKKDSAVAVLDHCMELVPKEIVPLNYFSLMIAENYFDAGATDKAVNIIKQMQEMFTSEMDYYLKLDVKFAGSTEEEVQRILYFMREMTTICSEKGQEDLATEIMEGFNKYLQSYSSLN